MSRTFPPIREAMAALAREELRGTGHPCPSQLIAYQRGGIPPAEAAELTEHLSLCDECSALVLDAAEFFGEDAARVLADISAFPNIRPAPGTPELSDEEITVRWPAFRERLRSVSGVPDRKASRARNS